MARRRVRIAAGFGSGGRAALLGSLLPSAQDQAEAKRVQRIKDNEKIQAFNTDQITYAELEAYFLDRKSRAIDEQDRAEVSAMLTSAKAANESKESNSALNAVKVALQNLQNGDALYEDVKAVIEANRGKVKKQEAIAQFDSLEKTARTIKVSRDISTVITDFNNGGNYATAKKALTSILSGETNEAIKGQITTAMTTMRLTENNRYMKAATEQFNLDGDFNAYAAALNSLIEAPDQTNADEVSKIQAAIETGAVVAQQSIDSKEYIAWQTHQKTDEEALVYFQGRLATAKNPKELEYLGKYAANVTQAMDNARKAAESKAASVGRAASSAANAAVANRDTLAHYIYEEFMKNTFAKQLEAAGSDPVKISKAYDLKYAMLVGPDGKSGLASLGGHHAQQYVVYSGLVEQERKDAISSALWKDWKAEEGKLLAEIIGPTATKLSLSDYVANTIKISQKAKEVLMGPYSVYYSDEQKETAKQAYNEALNKADERIRAERAVGRVNEAAVQTRISSLFSAANGKSPSQLAKITGLPVEQLNLQSVSDWVMADPQNRAPLLYNLSKDKADPADATKFTDDFMQAVTGSQKGVVFGGDAETTRIYVDLLNEMYPNSMMRAFGNKFTTDAVMADIEGSPEAAATALKTIEKISNQPFRGAELPASPENPSPGFGLIFDKNGDIAAPIWKPGRSAEQIAALLGDVWPEGSPKSLVGKPIEPAVKATIANFMAMGDGFENALKFTADTANFWGTVMEKVGEKKDQAMESDPWLSGKDWATPGSPMDVLGAIWSDTVGQAFSNLGANVKNQLDMRVSDFKDDIAQGTYEMQNFGGFTGQRLSEWADFTEQRTEEWDTLRTQRAKEWQEFGANTWDAIMGNVTATWNDTVSLFGGVQAAEPEPYQPSWNGWDSLTSEAQASIQDLIDRANQPGFTFNEPGGQVGPEIQPIAPIDAGGDRWWEDEAFNQNLPQQWNEPVQDWGIGGSAPGESSGGPMLTA